MELKVGDEIAVRHKTSYRKNSPVVEGIETVVSIGGDTVWTMGMRGDKLTARKLSDVVRVVSSKG